MTEFEVPLAMRRARCALGVLSLIWGCGSDPSVVITESTSGSENPALGSVELEVRLNDLVTLSLMEWSIEGNGFSDRGQLDVARRPLVTARLGGIPAGEGYRMRLSASQAQMSCTGSATFSIRGGGTTALRIELQCIPFGTTGQVEVTAPINVCPTVTELSAAPVELEVGDTAKVWGAATDPEKDAKKLTPRWEITGSGAFVSDGWQASLTCDKAGVTSVWLNVSDGGCETKAGLSIRCIVPALPRDEWPGEATVRVLDPVATFPQNLSGVTYAPATAATPATLWVVQNGPSRITPLYPTATGELELASEGPWRGGKLLTYMDGGGEPDSEGITFAAAPNIAYISTERNNDDSGVSRLSVLRYNLESSDTNLRATHEWNVTSQLPRAGANTGLEAITWVPDEYLVARGLLDERTNAVYSPTQYPAHEGGLFLVGVEQTGMIHAFALNHTSSEASRVASFTSGHPQVMGLEFDRDTGQLWAACDDGCQGESAVLSVKAGRFQVLKIYARPAGMPNINNEGIAFVPESECKAGLKPVFWVDDGNTAAHSVRGGLMPCGALPLQ
jgi:hypothetical protein